MIKIKKSPTADSRIAVGNPTKEDLLNSSIQHIGDVQKALAYIATKLIEAGTMHDWTKIDGIDDFYDSYSRKLVDAEFKKGRWFRRHVTEERHHLTDHCPKDVNLIDIIERVCDITMAGIARNGSIYEDNLDPAILQTAYKNTIKLLQQQVEIIDN